MSEQRESFPGTDARGAALELSCVKAGYGDGLILHEVSISVSPGCAAVVIGPNGAGKTTLLRAAAGTLRLTAGRRMMAGRDVSSARADQIARAGICYVPQGGAVFRGLTVAENVTMFAEARDRDAIDVALSAFPELRDRLRATVGTLSGGQQQMVALTRAFVRPSRVVLVDEASHGLAPIIVDRLYEAFEALRAAGRAVVVVEQFIERALDFGDTVYILVGGAVAHQGPTQDVTTEFVTNVYMGNDPKPIAVTSDRSLPATEPIGQYRARKVNQS